MSKGFQIEIQKGLSDEENKVAIDFANTWISKTCQNNMTYYLGGKTGGYKSFLRRNRFGFRIVDGKGLVFRRISTHKRIFGIVRSDTMVKLGGDEIRLTQCMCSKHLGGERVIWRNNKPETYVYAVIGVI